MFLFITNSTTAGGPANQRLHHHIQFVPYINPTTYKAKARPSPPASNASPEATPFWIPALTVTVAGAEGLADVLFDFVVALALAAGQPETLDDDFVAAGEAEVSVAEAPPVAVAPTAVDADSDADLTADVEAGTTTAEEVEEPEPVPFKTSVAAVSEELTLSTQKPAPVLRELLKAPTRPPVQQKPLPWSFLNRSHVGSAQD